MNSGSVIGITSPYAGEELQLPPPRAGKAGVGACAKISTRRHLSRAIRCLASPCITSQTCGIIEAPFRKEALWR